MHKQINIFLILIIIYFILKKKYNLFTNTCNNLSYRLGDVIKGYFFKENKTFLLNNCYPKYYPNSLATKYLKEIKNLPYDKKFSNLNVLEKLTKSNKKLDIALHLRLGDVIGNFNKKKNIFNQRAGEKKYIYFYQPKSYKKIAKKLNKMNINKVHVFYGSHTNDFDSNNKLYVKKVKKIFKQHNIDFIYSSTNDPDKDFILMSNSKIFIKSGGGYSRLIASLVTNKGNKVIIPDN